MYSFSQIVIIVNKWKFSSNSTYKNKILIIFIVLCIFAYKNDFF